MFNDSKLLRSLIVFGIFILIDFVIWELILSEEITLLYWSTRQLISFYGAYLVMALCFVWLFDHGWKGSGVSGGVRFGSIAGLFWAIGEFMSYAQGNLGFDDALIAFAGDVIIFVAAGAILGRISSRPGSIAA